MRPSPALGLALILNLALTPSPSRCKRLAGRQCPAVRFERVTLVTSAAVAEVMVRAAMASVVPAVAVEERPLRD